MLDSVGVQERQPELKFLMAVRVSESIFTVISVVGVFVCACVLVCVRTCACVCVHLRVNVLLCELYEFTSEHVKLFG